MAITHEQPLFWWLKIAKCDNKKIGATTNKGKNEVEIKLLKDLSTFHAMIAITQYNDSLDCHTKIQVI